MVYMWLLFTVGINYIFSFFLLKKNDIFLFKYYNLHKFLFIILLYYYLILVFITIKYCSIFIISEIPRPYQSPKSTSGLLNGVAHTGKLFH